MWWSRFFKNTPLKFFKQGDARPVHRRWIRLCRHTCCDKGPRCLRFHPIDRQVSPTYEKQIELIKSYVCYYFLYMHSKMNNGRNEGFAILTNTAWRRRTWENTIVSTVIKCWQKDASGREECSGIYIHLFMNTFVLVTRAKIMNTMGY